MLIIDGLEVQEMQIKFPHSDFDPLQFGFGFLTLQKDSRTFKMDPNEHLSKWLAKGLLSVPFYYLEEDDDLDDEDLQDLTKEDILSGLDSAELWVDEGFAEWKVEVEIISAHLILKNGEEIIRVEVTPD